MATLLKDTPPVLESELQRLVDPDRGRINGRVFSDPAIYQRELTHIFMKSWCFVAHESQLRNAGDYVTALIGEDPVIVSRDSNGSINVLLNSCRHRGLAVCSSDRGNTNLFRCPYHGWTYSRDGSLLGVPKMDEAYHRELAKDARGLIRVPRVESYKGFIFANWDADAIPLETYLGQDMLWYFDIPIVGALGGLEVIGPTMKFRMKANWKLASENFAGDDYHVLSTHGAAFRIGFLPDYDTLADYTAYFENGHGMGDIPKPGRAIELDRGMAQMFGPDAAAYVEAFSERVRTHLSDRQAELHSIGEGNVFPNLSWIKFGCFHAFGLLQWHPRGVDEIEVWQTTLFDSAAPQEVRDYARAQMSQENAAAGIFGQDDGENFERITEMLRGAVSGRADFDYSMGLGREGEVEVSGLPGRLGPHYTEQNHRNFYRHWLNLMTGQGG
ncbi:aromatic ring-hydroxylating oxygenase subunit alpha [Sphingosinicella xenopeptidilytica]|uniref:Aromatic ring-hydroxylating dioxygenase subunit alpha n=1 Tax=Sphingosinicella xenopeptidilytica TaxID=364098 RepID=A0ABW3C6B9_SPHXN